MAPFWKHPNDVAIFTSRPGEATYYRSMKGMSGRDWAWLILLLILINAAGYMVLTTYWGVTDPA